MRFMEPFCPDGAKKNVASPDSMRRFAGPTPGGHNVRSVGGRTCGRPVGRGAAGGRQEARLTGGRMRDRREDARPDGGREEARGGG
jgi:hypothetical protein